MLEKTIQKHLDVVEDIVDKVQQDFDVMFNNINIDDVVESPEDVLLGLVAELNDRIVEEYAPKAIEEGVKVAKTFDGMSRDLKIQDTNDPNIND